VSEIAASSIIAQAGIDACLLPKSREARDGSHQRRSALARVPDIELPLEAVCVGLKRISARSTETSAFPSGTDIIGQAGHVRFVPICGHVAEVSPRVVLLPLAG
jgi:hypothetical protein